MSFNQSLFGILTFLFAILIGCDTQGNTATNLDEIQLTLVKPAADAIVSKEARVPFEWHYSANPNGNFRLMSEISTDPQFAREETTSAFSQGYQGGELQVSTQMQFSRSVWRSDTLFWRMRVENGDYQSAWTETRRFIIE